MGNSQYHNHWLLAVSSICRQPLPLAACGVSRIPGEQRLRVFLGVLKLTNRLTMKLLFALLLSFLHWSCGPVLQNSGSAHSDVPRLPLGSLRTETLIWSLTSTDLTSQMLKSHYVLVLIDICPVRLLCLSVLENNFRPTESSIINLTKPDNEATVKTSVVKR